MFATNSYDAVIAFDLIEHLRKDDGYLLIANMLDIAKKKIIIFTPNGFLEQQAFDNNPYQQHLSGWTYFEMTTLGFRVKGVNGLKSLRGMYSKAVIKPTIFGNFISNLSQVIIKVFKIDKKAFALMCIKDKINL